MEHLLLPRRPTYAKWKDGKLRNTHGGACCLVYGKFSHLATLGVAARVVVVGSACTDSIFFSDRDGPV